MKLQRPVVATAVIFVFALGWNLLVHGVVLRRAERALDALARPPGERSLVLGLVLTAALAALFVGSFARCARHGGLREGLAHGLAFGLLAGLLVDLDQYLLYPLPGSLAAAWFGFGLLEFSVYGLLAGWLVPIAPRSDGGAPELLE